MEINQRNEGGARIISLFGVVGERDLAELDAVLIAHGSARIVLDLTRLDYINSQGISIFLAAWRRARREGGVFVLGAPRGAVRKIFEVAHISNFIAMRETIEEAIGAAGGQGLPAVKRDDKPTPGVTVATEMDKKTATRKEALKEKRR